MSSRSSAVREELRPELAARPAARRAVDRAAIRFVATETADFCAERGHHGPFHNLDRYENFPGWEGMGECLLCGGTVRAV